MNIILLNFGEIENNFVKLTGRRAEHINKVLGCKCGDIVRIGIIDGNLGVGKVVECSTKPHSATLEIDVTFSPPQRPLTDLILALPRPIMLKRILSQGAALGVGHFYIIHSKKVEKSFWASSLLEKEEYTEFLQQGLEQAAVDTRLPTVSFHNRFKPFIEDFFPAKKDSYSNTILAHPENKALGKSHSITSLLEPVSQKTSRTVFAIGPEGGWIDYEVKKFCEQGFVCGSMGDRILKVDTAAIVLLGLSALQGLQR